MSGISTHCPTSCGPCLHAGSHTCSGTDWDSLEGLGKGSGSPLLKAVTTEGDGVDGWVGVGHEKPNAADLEVVKTHFSFPGCWCWDSLSFPGIHTRPHPSALLPCTCAMLSSCCSSGSPLSSFLRASSRAGKLTEIRPFLLELAQHHGWNGLCILRINLAKSTFVHPT